MSRKFFSFLLGAFLFFCTSSVVLAADELYLGGESIGIEARYEGVLVTGTYAYESNGKRYDPADQFEAGDVITYVGDQKVKTLEELFAALSRYQEKENHIPITYKRHDKEQKGILMTTCDREDPSFRSGLYVKDRITGIGTLTYYDPISKTYGALGHEIMDTDLKQLAQIHAGSIYRSSVTSISKAQKHAAGEKHASIDYTAELGTIHDNTAIGIYGAYTGSLDKKLALPWAGRDEVQTGAAKLYTVLHGNEIEAFDIKILAAHTQQESDVKGIEFQIDDQRLMDAANGIVQGMSGSPIVQNGKIIGAVTHVITEKPQKGYGVYIEWMLEQSRSR